MNTFTNRTKWSILIAILAFVYVGCGGGGSGGTTDGGNPGGGDVITDPGGGGGGTGGGGDGGTGGGDGGTGGGDGGTGGGDVTTPVTNTLFGTLLLSHLDGGAFSAGIAINDAGTAVGYGESGSNVKGVKWSIAAPEIATELAPLAGNSYSAAYGVNIAGTAVGESGVTVDEAPDANTVAVIWGADNAVVQLLPPVGNDGRPYAAYGINGAGLIVGESTLDADGNTAAVLWTSSAAAPVSLHQSGWDFSAAYAIHDDGMIVGEAKLSSGAVQGVIWMPAGTGFTATLLPPAGEDTSSVAFGIDTLGRIVGESEGTEGVRGIVWTVNAQGTAVVETETLDDDTSLQAINDESRIVGYAGNRASVWNAANTEDSRNLAEVFSQAYGVNAETQIVGISGNQAFVASPVAQ